VRARLLLLHVVAPLATGSLIYVLWRRESLLVFTWLRAVGCGSLVLGARALLAPWRTHLPQFLLFSLPDAFWVYAFTSAIRLIWAGQRRSINTIFWVAVPSALALGSEMGQFLRIVPGTFDWSDVVAYSLAGLLASQAVAPERVTKGAPCAVTF